MKAVILAGGQGTRMGKYTEEIPKPMLEVGGKPILEHQIELLKRYNINEVWVLVNYLKDAIIEYFGDGEKHGVTINYYEEKTPLGTTGGIKEIEDELNEDFVVLYGDVMIDMNIQRLMDFHKDKNSECTLVLHPNDHPFDSDLVETNQDCRVIDFFPKPHPENLFYKNLVNAGAYVFSPAIFSHIEKGKKADFGRHVFPAIFDKIKMYGYNTAEYLKDMGTPDRWKEVESAYVSGKISRSNYDYKQKAIFLDRDGVINIEKSFINDPADYQLYDFTPEAVKKINQTEYKAIVITNQSAIARNISTFEELANIHKKMETVMGNAGAKIDELYFCPHHPDKGFPEEREEYKIECECRKPKPGMLLQAASEFNIDLKQSIMIGDTERDVMAGKNAGCYTAGVMTGYGMKGSKVVPDYFFANLLDATSFLTDAKNEALFSQMQESAESGNKPFIIGIGGNARTGKSNLAAFLKMRFEQTGQKVTTIGLDNWILPENKRTKEMNVFERFNQNQLEKNLEQILDGATIQKQVYKNHPNSENLTVDYNINNSNIIIIEGVIALSSEKLRERYSSTIFTQCEEKTRKQRLLDYYTWRGTSPEAFNKIYNSRVKDEYELIEKDSKLADQIVTN